MAKYLKKYTKELLDGMRSDGKSIVECCLIWGITDKEYSEWLDEHDDLEYAHQIGEMHCAQWWHQTYRGLAAKGNASVLQMGMKNIEKVGWQDRPETKKEEVEPIRAISITVLKPRDED